MICTWLTSHWRYRALQNSSGSVSGDDKTCKEREREGGREGGRERENSGVNEHCKK